MDPVSGKKKPGKKKKEKKKKKLFAMLEEQAATGQTVDDAPVAAGPDADTVVEAAPVMDVPKAADAGDASEAGAGGGAAVGSAGDEVDVEDEGAGGVLGLATAEGSDGSEGGGEDAETSATGRRGKKLSNKERRRQKKLEESKAREADLAPDAEGGASEPSFPFTVTHQTKDITDAVQWQTSKDINISSFTATGGKKGTALFVEAALRIRHGGRYGLIGPNGKGKTTLLRLMFKRKLLIPPSLDMLMVEQEFAANDQSALEAVLSADSKRIGLLEKEAVILRRLNEDDPADGVDLIAELRAVTDALEEIDAAAAEPRARKILAGLGFDAEMQDRETKKFSGGWRMRISLARALFMKPTLLLLDEPTNHLDLNAVLWLDSYLQKWEGTILIVSHDQDFLNNVVTDIIHLEEEKLHYYKGNYGKFKHASEEALRARQKAWEKQEKAIRAAKKAGAKTKAAEEKQLKKKREAGGAKKGKGKGAGPAEEKVEQLVTRPREYTVKLAFPDVASLSPPVVEVMDSSFGYEGHATLFENLNFGIDLESRISIVGPNGAGKSTLLRMLMGELPTTTGEIRRNHKLRIGKYNQHFVEALPMGISPVQYLLSKYPEEGYQKVRQLLGRYGLKGHAHEIAISQCSGGQKARVALADISLQNPHILFLDEPTNHLDIETIDALAVAINEFNGGVVLVSHDARLILDCECDLWLVQDKSVVHFEEGFEEYRDQLLEALAEQDAAEEAKAVAKEAARKLAKEEAIRKAKERAAAKQKKAEGEKKE